MLQAFFKNKFNLFITKAVVLYGFCYFMYEFVIKQYTKIDQQFIRKIINFSSFILESFGYKTFASKEVDDFQVFGIDGSGGVWIGGPCNGITLMFLFAIFVIAYPGNIKNKLWYLPVGIVIVHLVNITRIVALAIIALHSPKSLEFNHTYTFTFIAYSIVFGMWMLWANKFSKTNSTIEKLD